MMGIKDQAIIHSGTTVSTIRQNIGLGASYQPQYPHAGALNEDSDGQLHVYNGTGWLPLPLSIENREEMDAYERRKRLLDAEASEKREALKTIFPRGHAPIENFDIMVDVVREDQLNPLYEQVLKEFEEAQAALHRAANKLASAAKLTDLEEINQRAKPQDWSGAAKTMKTMSGKTAGNIFASSGSLSAASVNTGPMGPQGAPGLKGDKGDPGVVDETMVERAVRKLMGKNR